MNIIHNMKLHDKVPLDVLKLVFRKPISIMYEPQIVDIFVDLIH